MDNRTIKYILVLILSGLSCSYAQQPDDYREVAQDSSEIVQRQFNEDLEQRYSSGDFNYDRTQGEAQNLLSRMLNRFFNALAEAFGITISPETAKVLEIIIYVLMGILVVFLLLRFFSGEKLSSLFSKRTAAIASFNFREENMAHTDFRALIKQALSAQDYRLATRYLYLLSLQELASCNLIAWHFEKTNREYYREIQSPEIQALFKDVSYFFDHVWYGEFPVDNDSFAYAEKRFNALHQLIKKHFGQKI